MSVGLIVVLLVTVMWRLGSERRKNDSAQSAHYAALQRQVRYDAVSFGSRVEFPFGYAHRVSAYDPFSFHGRVAELATCNDTIDGETWAEFYTLASDDTVQAALPLLLADETHRVIRSRLAHQFDYGYVDRVSELKGKIQVLQQGEYEQWHVRVSYIETPHGVGQVMARQIPRSEILKSDIVAELPIFGVYPSDLSAWVWIGLDDFRSQSERNAFRLAERAALEKLRNRQDEYERARERFERTHRHFYIVEAVKSFSPTHIVALRRFGPLVSQSTAGQALAIILQMIASHQYQ